MGWAAKLNGEGSGSHVAKTAARAVSNGKDGRQDNCNGKVALEKTTHSLGNCQETVRGESIPGEVHTEELLR